MQGRDRRLGALGALGASGALGALGATGALGAGRAEALWARRRTRSQQVLSQCAHRLAAVAYCRFLFVRHFAERLSVGRIEEDRVIAKPVRTGRSIGKSTFHCRRGFEHDVATIGQGDGAHEPGVSARRAARVHSCIDGGKALGVRRIFATDTAQSRFPARR